nr:MarR family transcriptional regulator [Kineosporia rhizophila]
MALVRLSTLVQSVFTQVADRHGLPPSQARMLCVLAGRPSRMAELARACGVEKAAVTGLVDRAERRGLLLRSPVPGDRRASLVSLTPPGLSAATAFHQEVTEHLDQLLAGLGETDRAFFAAAMDALLRSAGPDRARELQADGTR